MIPLAKFYRGGHAESVHFGSIAVVDSRGRLLAFAGDPHQKTFLRSTAKPFQALPFLSEGGAGEYDLSGEEIALICASHGGEPHHVATAAALLRREELDESDLHCGAHPPLDERSAAELRMTGEAPSALHNNCSGKHAGMLLACALRDEPLGSYLDPAHPLQRAIAAVMSEFTGLPPSAIPIATDNCGAPTFYLSIYRAAWAWARLVALASGYPLPGLESWGEPAHTALSAMIDHPEYVAGSWTLTTPLIRSMQGGLVAKDGAEGVYVMGLFPRMQDRNLRARLGLEQEGGLAIVLKVADGAHRARGPVVLRCLANLGIVPPPHSGLQPYTAGEVVGINGRIVGEVRAEFDLSFL